MGGLITFKVCFGSATLRRSRRIVELMGLIDDRITGSGESLRGSWAVRSSWLIPELTDAMVRADRWVLRGV